MVMTSVSATVKALVEHGRAKHDRVDLVEVMDVPKGHKTLPGIIAHARNLSFASAGIVHDQSHAVNTQDLFLAYYPKSVAHAEQFASAIKSVSYCNPAELVPGSAGVAYATLHENKGAPHDMKIHYIQYSFSQEKSNLSRALVTQYMGWQDKALRFFFEKAKKTGLEHVKYQVGYARNDDDSLYLDKQGKPVLTGKSNETKFKEIAAQYGFKIHEPQDKTGEYEILAARQS